MNLKNLRNTFQVSKIILSIFYAIFILFIIAWLGAILPANYWIFSSFGVLFPIAFILMGVISMVLLLLKPKKSVLFILASLFAMPTALLGFAFGNTTIKHSSDCLRVVQWNINGPKKQQPKSKNAIDNRRELANFCTDTNPDVLILQEFTFLSGEDNNLSFFTHTLGFNHFTFSEWTNKETQEGILHIGNAIFSKTPIIHQGEISYCCRTNPEKITYAMLNWKGKPICIATTHFASMHLTKPNNVGILANDVSPEDSIVAASNFIITKLKYFLPYHQHQAKILNQFAENFTFPLVIGADLNTLPYSNNYQIAKGKLQDAFLSKGFGFGGTYSSFLPFVRIDYLFCSANIGVENIWVSKNSISDHYPIIADLHFP